MNTDWVATGGLKHERIKRIGTDTHRQDKFEMQFVLFVVSSCLKFFQHGCTKHGDFLLRLKKRKKKREILSTGIFVSFVQILTEDE